MAGSSQFAGGYADYNTAAALHRLHDRGSEIIRSADLLGAVRRGLSDVLHSLDIASQGSAKE